MKELSLRTRGRFSERRDWFARFINEDFHFRTELIRTSDSYENCKEIESLTVLFVSGREIDSRSCERIARDLSGKMVVYGGSSCVPFD